MHEAVKEKMRLKQGFAYMTRGFGIIRKLFPWYFTLSSISSVLKAVQPLVTLYFSARIIDELAGARDLSRIVPYVGIVIGASFVFRIVNSFISRKSEIQGSTNWFVMQLFKGDRYASMDYEYVEDSGVNELLADILAKENANWLGILRLYWFYPNLYCWPY